MCALNAESSLTNLADESPKTKKVREKLKKHLEEIDKQVTKSALERKSIEIQRWLARHADKRVVLRSRNIEVYDPGSTSTKVSKKVTTLIDRLKESISLNSFPSKETV